MKIHGFTALALGLVTAATAHGGLILSLENITVTAEPAGGNAVTAFMEVFVQNDNPALNLSSFQAQVKLADEFQRDVVTSGVGEATAHPQLLAGAQAFATRPDSVTAIYAKFGFGAVPLVDNGGLARIEFSIAPGIEGVYQVNLITSTQDPAFGTILIDGSFVSPLPYTAVNGSVTVVIPEPAAAVVLAGLLPIRRRQP